MMAWASRRTSRSHNPAQQSVKSWETLSFFLPESLAWLSVILSSITRVQIVQPFNTTSDPGLILGETGFDLTFRYCAESHERMK